MTFDRSTIWVFVLSSVMLVAPAASADWTVYVSGDLGISTGVANVSGTDTLINPAINFDDGNSDASPMIAGAVGIAIPWSELMAWELPYDLKLPEWPVRMELEMAGLRDFEYRTINIDAVPPQSDELFLSSSKSWSIMTNFWFDLPMKSFYRPIRALFGRTPRRVRDIMDPISLYGGVGLGASELRYDSVSTSSLSASESDWRFAWQAGAGVGYELTKFVSLTTGYRYFKQDGFNVILQDNVGVPRGNMVFVEDIHEFRAAVRVNVYSFRNPWLLLK